MTDKEYNRLKRQAKMLSKQREKQRKNKKNEYREAHEEDWYSAGEWN